MKEFKNILIVRTDRIGDIILTTPAIKALKKRFKDARITILVTPQTKDLIEGNPYLDEILVDDRKKDNKYFFGFLKLIVLLWRKKFDLAVVYHTKKRTNLLCFLAGIPNRLGYKNNKFGGLLNMPVIDVRNDGKRHESEYCLLLLKCLGIEEKEVDLYVTVKKEAEEWVQKTFSNISLSGKKIIGIHPGASDPSRRWPVENFIELMNKIVLKYNCLFVVLGDAFLRNEADKIKKEVKAEIIDLIAQTNVSQLVSIIKKMDLLISNDSGPVHVAVALEKPLISIFTRNQPGINDTRWRPLNKQAITISVPLEDKVDFSKAGKIDPKNLQNIPVSRVLEAVDALIKLC